MTSDKLSKEIESLIAKIVKIPAEKINGNANLFADLGVDSLLGVEIFAALDKKYGLDIPEAKLRNVNTLNDIVNLVKELLC